jgi:branched-chain amino acid transport system ATP-binding protein
VSTPEPGLLVEGVQTYYGKSHVLWDVSLHVQTGEVVALMGRNGAGKTTTINSIAGLLKPRAGKVVVEGRDVTKAETHKRVRAGLGLVPAHGRLFKSLSIRENLELVRGRPVVDPFTVDEVFGLFPRIAEFPDRMCGALSGGERQMVAFGRALMANPSVLLLDEPSEGLAPLVVETLRDTIDKLRAKGMGVLLCEQNHHFAFAVATRAYMLEKGRICHMDDVSRLEETGALERYLGV